jgi:ribonucleoside-triphosphate reductase (thioredoxin)
MNEDIASYMLVNHPELCEVDQLRSDVLCVRVPMKAPEGAILRTESAIDLLERVKLFSDKWIKPGHNDGINTHNVSATISIKEGEWDAVGNWMWDNKDTYNGLSVLPYHGGTYVQTPFENCTKEEYERRVKTLVDVDLTKVSEIDDNTAFNQESACAGGKCEINV